MEPKINIEEIEQYLSGHLEGSALENFQQRLQTDKDLAKRVALMENIDLAMTDEKALQVQKTVMDLGEDFFKKKSKPEAKKVSLPFYRRPLFIAASFLLLISFGFLLWSQMGSNPISNQTLFAHHYTPYSANDAVRGTNPEQSLYHQAIRHYQTKNYAAAIADFQKWLADKPSDMQAFYCLAHAYLNLEPPDFEQASANFQKVIRDGKSIQVPKSQWYLALSYLAQDQKDRAVTLLEQLLKSEDDQIAQQATKLLDKIN